MSANQLISYAQNFEDIMLYRALRHVSKGFYIDVGAWDPVEDSVTKLFYDIGWSGINVEPVKYWYGRLVAERERDLNLMVAISNKKGVMKFYEVVGTGLSTADEEIALKHKEDGYEVKEYWVPCLTLNDICSTYEVEEIHFLKIDVEGKEKEVLEGLDLSKHRPWIIVVESVDPVTQKPVEPAWDEYLFENGYIFVYYDGLNRFYLADEHAELKKYFKYPPCIFDGFIKWGEYKAKVENSVLKGKIAEIEKVLFEEKSVKEGLIKLKTELEQAKYAAETRAAELEQTLNAVNSENAVLKQRISELEMERTETDNRIKALEEVANSLKFENIRLEQRVVELSKELGIIEKERMELKQRIELLEQEKEGLIKLKTELEQAKYAAETRAAELEQTLNAVNSENAVLKQRISELEEQIQGFYSSVSWRITAPLRAAHRTYLWVKGKLRNVSSKVRAKVSGLFLEVLSKLARWAIKHYSLVRLGKWLLSKNKRLEMLTLRLISGQVDQPYQVEQQHIQSPNQVDPTDLPESARRIYFELIKALKVDRYEDSY